MNFTLSNSTELFHAIPCIVTLKDLNSVFIDSTDYWARLVGYKNADQIAGIRDYDMRCKAAELADSLIAEDKQVIESEKKKTALNILFYQHEQKKILVSNKSPLYDANQQMIGTIAHAVEITDGMLLDLCHQLVGLDEKRYYVKENEQISYVLETAYPKLTLSQRETECLFYLLRGKSNKAIGHILHISERTVETHVDHIKNKMGCLTRGEVIEKAVSLGLINIIPKRLFA